MLQKVSVEVRKKRRPGQPGVCLNELDEIYKGFKNFRYFISSLRNCVLWGSTVSSLFPVHHVSVLIAQPTVKFRSCSVMSEFGIYHSQEDCLKILEDELQSSPSSEIQEVIKVFEKLCRRGALYSDEEKRHPFIVMEGLDGSGKSTMSKIVAKRLGGVKMSTPGESFLHLRPFFDKQPNHVRRAYYSLSNYAAASEIKEILKERPVILDRFWHSTAAYALAGKVNAIAELPQPQHPVYMWPKDLKPYPDVVFFLTVSEAERLRRFRGRNTTNTAEEVRLANESNYRLVLHEVYRRMYEPAITEVDASRPNVKAVANHIVDLIQQHVKG